MIDTKRIRHNASRWDGSQQKKLILLLCAEIDRLRAPKPQPQPQGKTVRVKVAVAVDEGGYWRAEGWDNAPKGSPEELAKKHMDGVFHIYTLTADLPIPEETTVVAEVDDGR